MKHDPVARCGSTLSTVRLHTNQALTVSLPRNARVIAAEGGVELAFLDPTLDWLGEAAPVNRLKLYEGDSYVIERSCYATVSGASSAVALVHIQIASAVPFIVWLRTWFARRMIMNRTSAALRKAR
ncbi:hypothetical protein [Paraburkholderia susongensis]|uniref:Uncharacterized protein n=1 Tax=Paraburkholderia susongensis TaxID=1515439 RepID=A0A1X7HV47_9BURK|nr:hypothetical protein [Paraburkholderia susongensis]SMG05787.1 hypothetical protein SAMN06265784_10113 [Paraburkholderia susongensis]